MVPHLAQGRDGDHTPEVPEQQNLPHPLALNAASLEESSPAEQLGEFPRLLGSCSFGVGFGAEQLPGARAQLSLGGAGEFAQLCRPWPGRAREPANRSIKGLSLTPMGCK